MSINHIKEAYHDNNVPNLVIDTKNILSFIYTRSILETLHRRNLHWQHNYIIVHYSARNSRTFTVRKYLQH